MDEHVTSLMTYEAQNDLLTKNITPVVPDQLSKDGMSLPPKDSGKRKAGRPKTKRIRNRSKFIDPSQSSIICSRCRRPGHNARTCSVDLGEIQAQVDETEHQIPNPDES